MFNIFYYISKKFHIFIFFHLNYLNIPKSSNFIIFSLTNKVYVVYNFKMGKEGK